MLRPVLALQQGAVERQSLFADPVQLRAERDSLAAFLVGQAGVAAENRQLRQLLGLQERLPPSFVPAEVVRLPGRGSEGYFQLTAGADQGVRPGASIVAAQGLVGRVRDVDSSIAFGIDWMHPEFRASAMTLDGEVYGILEPRTIDGEPVLALTGTPRHVELAPNTVIVTSGHGGVFPRGIPIGTVVGPEGGEAEWQRNYVVRPFVAPSEMAYVLVLGDPEPSLAGRDLALAWGIMPEDSVAPAAPVVGASPAPAAASPASSTPARTTPSPAPSVTAPARPPATPATTPATPAPSPSTQPVTPPPPPPPPPPPADQGQGPRLLGDPVLPQ